MIETNLAQQIEKTDFSEWDYLVSETAKVFGLNTKQTEQLYNSNTAKIIARLPFVARCKEPERTAIAHLVIYEAELLGFQKYCSHLPSDDDNIFNRLAFISTFDGGNQAVIEHGMNMLAYIMVEGYNHSKEKDVKNGVYNPIANGKWNYNELKKQLLAKLQEIDCSELDELFIPEEPYWN